MKTLSRLKDVQLRRLWPQSCQLTSSTRPYATQTEESIGVEDKRLRMRAWQLNGYDGVEGLSLEMARIPPILRPSDVLVKVHAASVNPIDTVLIGGYGRPVLNIMRALGQLEQGIVDPNQTELPITGGRDFVGEVVGVGQRVRGISVGQRVLGVVSPQGQGSHAEFVVTPSSNVCSLPDDVNTEEAASLPYTALTGWSAVVVSGMITPGKALGKRVLVLGAAGGVGSFLCQLLSVWGAQVTGVCSNDAMDLVASLGAEPLDYTDPSTKPMLTADKGYDLIINAAGKDDLEYLSALKPWMGASYVTLSPPLLTNIDQRGLAAGLIKSAREIACQNLTSLSEGRVYKWAFFMPNTRALSHITHLLATHMIRGVVDGVFPFSQTPQAYKHVLNGHARGKTIITLT
ncbi:hypothetical protein Pmani_018238 [Petrolisthes manimaculis]|uniref:Enoyl reductase (ER) domain-containing protein n=1 Tax=Petrolisthes manimaculis TaxID=1843537 RepID=A0AAE1U8J8_9EUCA|nr:hypothetical protein Pmani_018238 [Petrolisthes manimaculis]